jgi:glycine/D-amino acid oxidase-like deaminating enzyme
MIGERRDLRSEAYARRSFWLETAGDDLTPRAALDGSTTVDVAILGAGFTGLWTAYYLLQRQPPLRIAVVEKEIAGFGASGRNGGWCAPRLSVSPALLRHRAGQDAARAVYHALSDAVDEVGRVASAERIDAHFAKDGSLRVALGPHHLPRLLEARAAFEALGLGDRYRLLNTSETAERIRITRAVASVYNPDCAVVHPGRLARGLARAVERRGATLYEQTEVVDFIGGRSPRLITTRGDVRAQTIVLAGEAYLSKLRRLHRQVIPVYSQIMLTEPLTPAQWAEIGWDRRVCVHSCRLTADYLSKTTDGRIAVGGRGAPYLLGSRIDDARDVHPPTQQILRDLTGRWFPGLRGIAFTHAWGGPIGVSRDWMPTFFYDLATGVASARGYGGLGVAASNLGGRVLAELITNSDSPLKHLPMVGHRSRDWEPEPLRWLAMRFVQAEYRRLDDAEERSGKVLSGRSLAERLSRH